MMLDRAIIEFDKALRTLFAPAPLARPMPGAALPDTELDDAQRRNTAALMRINHVGEICAQALYQGQAITSRQPEVKAALERAAREETEHLAWTERRIAELGGRKSLLNPLWYLGALGLGTAAGLIGDRINLGFLAETERQVEAHLSDHLQRLPETDQKSRAIINQMRDDEIRHAETAVSLGAVEFPSPVRLAMKLASRVMTRTAYWV